MTRILIYELERHNSDVIVLTGSRNEEWFPESRNVKFELVRNVIELCKPDVTLPYNLERIVDLIYSLHDVIHRYDPDVVLTMIQEPIYGVLVKIVRPDLRNAIYIHYPIEEEVTSENLPVFISRLRFPTFYEQFYKVIDLHMTNSNYTAQALYTMFGIESNVVYPAIEWDFFEQSLENEDLSKKREKVILTIGRFVPHKRHDILIDWFKRIIKPRIPDARLIVIGMVDERHKQYYERLKSLASDVKDVELVDRVLSTEELIRYYREASILVHLRIGEHFGLVPVEAASQGTIPIVPAKSGIAELVSHGRDGFLAHTDEEFIKYIFHTLEMPPDELVKIRRCAVRKAWYFNPDRFAKEILASLRIIARHEKV